MILSSFKSLKEHKVSYGTPKSTNDLVNGLFVTINTTSNDFDYANAYELLPDIVSVFYECIDSEPYALKPITALPNKDDIDYVIIANKILFVYSIGINRNGEKTHIHLWVYNLHSFNYDYCIFCRQIDRKLKGLKGISRRNEFSVKLIPCTDSIDAKIRQSNYNNQVIVNYIKDREYDTLMNYFSTKNSKDFICFY